MLVLLPACVVYVGGVIVLLPLLGLVVSILVSMAAYSAAAFVAVTLT